MDNYGKLTVKEFNEFFQFKQITGDEKSLDKNIVVPDINRPGLELAGFYEKSVQERIIIIGAKEKAYIKNRDKEELLKSFDYITSETTPCIVITHDEEVPPLLKDIAESKNFPIFVTSKATNMIVVDIIGYLDEKLAQFDNVHGVLMSIFGEGVLITGKSGIGKSELALDLINRGHLLVADDRVDCYRVHNEIVGKAPSVLQHYLELRGVGIVDVVKVYGARAYLDDIRIEFVINLEHFDVETPYDRLGREESYEEIMGISLPVVTLPVTEGRNMAVIVEAAVINWTLKKMGYNSSEEFNNRVISNIERNK